MSIFLNKARNSHKPRLGEFVQQGNIKSISCIVKGDPFYLLSIFSSECGLAQLILPLFVFFERVEAWRQETAMPTLVPVLPCQSSPDNNWLQCLGSCKYTCSIPYCFVCTVCVVCAHVLYNEWLYSCLLSESSNFKLGRLDINKPVKQGWCDS